MPLIYKHLTQVVTEAKAILIIKMLLLVATISLKKSGNKTGLVFNHIVEVSQFCKNPNRIWYIIHW